jgi:hypothetical protein
LFNAVVQLLKVQHFLFDTTIPNWSIVRKRYR